MRVNLIEQSELQMLSGTYSFPNTIRFGAGCIRDLPADLKQFGQRPLVVTDPGVRDLPLMGALIDLLRESGLDVAVFAGAASNPTTDHVEAGRQAYIKGRCDCVVGVGGGSPIDVAKAIGLAVSHPGSVIDYDNQLDGWKRIGDSVPPILAVPTTAGTGSEVGRSAVITNIETNLKTVIFSPRLLPRIALIDPELMFGLPPHLTAATGMDALSHNIEAFVSKGFHPMADGIALEGIRMIGLYLERAVNNGLDVEARSGMAIASAMGAVAFQKGLGATHSLAHPLSTLAGMHHGLANALFLHRVMAFNRESVEKRLARIGQSLGVSADSQSALAEGAIEAVASLATRIGIPANLNAAGVSIDLLDGLVEQAVADSCHLCNPKPCTAEDFRRLYTSAFDA